MRRVLTPAEVEGLVGPCNTSLCRSERDADGEWHVYRLQPDGSEREMRLSWDWEDIPFDQMELSDASGEKFERLVEALSLVNLRTVREFLMAYETNDERLGRLVYAGDARLMNVKPKQVRAFVEHLQRRRAEWERRKQS